MGGRLREATLFWQMASELRHALSEGAEQVEIEQLYEEIEGVMVNTDSDTLRARCNGVLQTRYRAVDQNTG